jgi:tRNA pseudouridine38-40 synthase
VAGELTRALETVLRHPVGRIVCAGRTDAGVHARGQVIHVDIDAAADLTRLPKALNSLLAPGIVVRSCRPVPEAFDARRSARSRHYRYLVLESPVADPLLAPIAWVVPGPLDLRAMATASDALIGEHDFRAFCRRPPGTEASEPILRRVLEARWSEGGENEGELGDSGRAGRLLRFDITARSFCHQMVRSLVGMLVDVGTRRRRASDVHFALLSGDRSHAGQIAPPHGLCLVAVDYAEQPDPPDQGDAPGPPDPERSPASSDARTAATTKPAASARDLGDQGEPGR